MNISDRVQSAQFPVVYHAQQIWFSGPSQATGSASRFGGQRALSVEPDTLAKHLYRTITLDLNFFGVGGQIAELPLLFPFTLSGGKIEYVVRSVAHVAIESSHGKPRTDWPYKNYPREFPSVPIRFSNSEGCSFQHLTRGLPQGLGRSAEDKMIVILPPTEAFGVGIWFPIGRIDEHVFAIFEVDLDTYRVRAYNQCT